VQFGRLPSILENALYRIAQEALTNACKHSKSKKVTVTMTQEGQDVRLEVRDWGIGFDPSRLRRGTSVWRAFGKGCGSSAVG
jgi:signal transduction histidine kinase